MKSKNLFQVLTLLALVFSVLGASQPAQAAPAAAPVIVSYDMTVWNATYPGIVSDLRYEKWAFNLTEETHFVARAISTSGNLLPVISLLDVNGNEISTLADAVESTQPAGKYYLLVKPQSGSGGYNLTLQKIFNPVGTIGFSPAEGSVGESVVATVGLGNVPAEGYASAEFTCTYDPALLEVSGFTDKGLFGADAVMVMNGPANGSFIVAIAGSNGNKAVTAGEVFSFSAKALKIGEATVACNIRVSNGGSALNTLNPISGTLSIIDQVGNILGKVNASKPVTVCAYDAANVEACTSADETGVFNMPNMKVGDYKLVASAEGFLKAEAATVTVEAGQETLMPQISLLAGDIDGNGVIDQFDAMTIGMSYNTATPAAADLNNDATINVLDLELLAANYHKTGPTVW